MALSQLILGDAILSEKYVFYDSKQQPTKVKGKTTILFFTG